MEERKLTFEEQTFADAMDLLVCAVVNVNNVCNYSGWTEILIDYLRETADDIEKICIEDLGEDWRVNNKVHNDLINDEIKIKC